MYLQIVADVTINEYFSTGPDEVLELVVETLLPWLIILSSVERESQLTGEHLRGMAMLRKCRMTGQIL